MQVRRLYLPLLLISILTSGAFGKPKDFRCSDFTGHYGSTDPDGKATIQCTDGHLRSANGRKYGLHSS
jgi:hypothetical protein